MEWGQSYQLRAWGDILSTLSDCNRNAAIISAATGMDSSLLGLMDWHQWNSFVLSNCTFWREMKPDSGYSCPAEVWREIQSCGGGGAQLAWTFEVSRRNTPELWKCAHSRIRMISNCLSALLPQLWSALGSGFRPHISGSTLPLS